MLAKKKELNEKIRALTAKEKAELEKIRDQLRSIARRIRPEKEHRKQNGKKHTKKKEEVKKKEGK